MIGSKVEQNFLSFFGLAYPLDINDHDAVHCFYDEYK
jgi:hypothetical protein